MQIQKQSLLIALLIGFSSSLYAIPPDITGTYQCNGYDPFGKVTYTNPLAITRINDTYNFQWIATTGSPLVLGTGLFHKNMDNAIAVVFWDPRQNDYFGTEIFQVLPDGTLNANWVLQGQNLIGTETCTPTEVE